MIFLLKVERTEKTGGYSNEQFSTATIVPTATIQF
jgi:hypothetical protein